MNNSIDYNQIGNVADFLGYNNNSTVNTSTNASANNPSANKQYYPSSSTNSNNLLSQTGSYQQNDVDLNQNLLLNFNCQQQQQQQQQNGLYNCNLNTQYSSYYNQQQSPTIQTHLVNTNGNSHFDFLTVPNASTVNASTTTSASLSTLTPPLQNANANLQNSMSLNGAYMNHHQSSLHQSKHDSKKHLKLQKEVEEEDEDDECDEDDEDEDDEEGDENDCDDDEDDDINNSYFISSTSRPSNANKRARKTDPNDLDNDAENDYEIKHNCLTEEGVYMNSLFNSPSSLSSSGSNPKANDAKSAQAYNESKKHTSKGNCKKAGSSQKFKHAKLDQQDHLKQGPQMVVTKMENLDESEQQQLIANGSMLKQPHYTTLNPSSLPSSSCDSSDSSMINNEPCQVNKANQHMNNMINSYNMAGIMNDFDLVNLPLRELNKRLRFLPKQMAYNMKKRRRTLKNRKYAQNCRSKRLEQKSEMEIQNNQLKLEINRLNKIIDKLQNENQSYKAFLGNNKSLSSSLSANSSSPIKNQNESKASDNNNNNVNNSVNNIFVNNTTTNTSTNTIMNEDKQQQLNNSNGLISSSMNLTSTSNTITALNSPSNNDAKTSGANSFNNLPLTPTTPTATQNNTFTTFNSNSQLTHLLSLPLIKSDSALLSPNGATSTANASSNNVCLKSRNYQPMLISSITN